MKAQATIAFVVAALVVIGAMFTVVWLAPSFASKWRQVDFATAPADDTE